MKHLGSFPVNTQNNLNSFSPDNLPNSSLQMLNLNVKSTDN